MPRWQSDLAAQRKKRRPRGGRLLAFIFPCKRSESVNHAEGGARTTGPVRRISQQRRIVDQRKGREDVITGGAQGQTRAQFVFHAYTGSSRKGDVGGLVFTAGVFAAQHRPNEYAGVPEEFGLKDGPEQNRIDRWVSRVARLERVLVSGPVGDESEVLAKIAGDGELYALQPVARSVDLVDAGVAVADVGFVLVGVFTPLCIGGFVGRGNLASGRQGQKRGRNH